MQEPAVVSMMRIKGDPDELVAKAQKTIEPVADQKAAQYGGISSTIVKTDDGIMIINFWANEEGRHKMADDPDVRRAVQEANFPAPGFEGYPVLAHRTVATAGVR
jgi:hypothetical protein